MAEGSQGGAYPKTVVNGLKRLPNRGAYDYTTVHKIINSAPILHVSFNDPEHPFPVVLPMLGCTGNFSSQNASDSEQQDIYIHGYVSGRMFKQSGEAGSSGEQEGLPITISAAHMDGLVLSLTPFHNSCNYRSAVAYGYATLLSPQSDSEERMYAMQRITENMLPQRWDKSRVPPTKAELDSTSILKVRVVSASAKVRVGGPSEDRGDLKDKELVKSVWTGVVPCWTQWGEPVAGRENGYGKEGGGEVEGYIEKWRLEENMRGKMEAYGAVGEGK